jgi:hypothetical protein
MLHGVVGDGINAILLAAAFNLKISSAWRKRSLHRLFLLVLASPNVGQSAKLKQSHSASLFKPSDFFQSVPKTRLSPCKVLTHLRQTEKNKLYYQYVIKSKNFYSPQGTF